jgi:ribosomal protein S18 acetylase RimI-like enzyme
MLTLRRATADDADQINRLIALLAPLFYASPDGEGAEKFRESITPQALTLLIMKPAMTYFVAEDEGDIRGAVAIRDDRHLLHLFVDPASQHSGLGRQLWTAARDAVMAAGGTGEFTVNASLNAVPVYRRFGFEIVGTPQQANGLIFLPMKLVAAI